MVKRTRLSRLNVKVAASYPPIAGQLSAIDRLLMTASHFLKNNVDCYLTYKGSKR